MKRLYVVVRNDLPPGLQLAQACHAVRAFTEDFPEADVGENLVALGAEPFRLAQLALRACIGGLDCSYFFEPDLRNELTAIASSGDLGKLVGSLPLALRDR